MQVMIHAIISPIIPVPGIEHTLGLRVAFSSPVIRGLGILTNGATDAQRVNAIRSGQTCDVTFGFQSLSNFKTVQDNVPNTITHIGNGNYLLRTADIEVRPTLDIFLSVDEFHIMCQIRSEFLPNTDNALLECQVNGLTLWCD